MLPRCLRKCINPNCRTEFTCIVTSSQKYCRSKCIIAWNKGLTKETDERVARNGKSNSISLTGLKHTQKRCETNRARRLEQWSDSEYRKSQMEAIVRGVLKAVTLSPNKTEERLDELLQKLFPGDHKFVGDGEVIIGSKCPDFINVNGQKKIIEMFGDYWHGEEFTGRTKIEEENQRIECFAQYGYKTLIIWECELSNINVLNEKITVFAKKGLEDE